MPISRSLAAGAAIAWLLAATAGEAAWPDAREAPVPPAEIGGQGVFLAQAGDTDRLNRIEETMRSLTGQIEELTYQLRLLQDQMKRMQEDTDFRFSELGGTAPARPAQDATETGVAAGAEQADAIGSLADAPPITSDDLQLGAPPKPLGTLTLDAPPPPEEQPLDLSSLAGGDIAPGDPLAPGGMEQPQVASIAPSGDPRFDYDQAYSLIRAGQYDTAEAAFRQFLGAYPGDELAPEAQYWLGESFFARGDYTRAAEEFRAGYKAYPKSRRGPDTLLKLGLSMAGLGYREEACQMYAATLKQYPDMSNGLRQRVKNEQASASC